MFRSGFLRRIATPIFIAAAALAASGVLAQALISGSVIAPGGGTSRSAGECYALDATVGEPTAGRTSGGAFALDAGYQAGVGRRPSVAIFRNGFERCE